VSYWGQIIRVGVIWLADRWISCVLKGAPQIGQAWSVVRTSGDSGCPAPICAGPVKKRTIRFACSYQRQNFPAT